jgi:ethanolamine utilization protein EutN
VILGTVVGRVWNERQVPGLEGRRLVAVRVPGGAPVVAVDLIDVAAGNTVLLATDEAAQAAVGGDTGGVDAAVVSLVAGADALADLAGSAA